MRKLFFVFCGILAFNICLAEKWWENNFIIGAQWGPPLQYNEENVLTRNFTLLKNGKFNFTLGKMNPHNNYSETFLTSHLLSLIEECNDSGLFFLNDTADSRILNDPAYEHIIYGITIKDEPLREDSLIWLDSVSNIKQHNPNLLGFINLYPSHASAFSDFNDWKQYVNTYLGDTTLQIACFDNYNPHSNFVRYRPSPKKNYYANLTYMKQVAGSRPLWAFLRCAGKFVEEKDTAWQDAFIRIGAFAPLAFGARGIIYFCYDCQDRNRIRRAPNRGAWKDHDMYFDNDEKSRQIFFGNFKYNANNVPDLAIHTNDSIGTWYIKESLNNWIENDSNPLIKIGWWFGDHVNNMPNIYNWDFASDGRDKFTTITRDGRLLLSKFRSGWTHKALIDIPWSCWSSMTRHTCPFADFNENQKLDLCLGWTENGHGKLRICMDCEEDAIQDPSTTITDMSFANTSQVFTFSDSIKQVFTRHDSIWVITATPFDTVGSYVLTDGVCLLKYCNGQFDSIYNSRITLDFDTRIEHYWMEDSLYGQDYNGIVWGEVYGQAYNMTKKIKGYSSRELYVWGQYNSRTDKYDRYSIAPEVRSSGYQSYALLDRKGNPTRTYHTAKAVNQFINNNISQIIQKGNWLGAYFSTKPNQQDLDSLKFIIGSEENPFTLINTAHTLTNRVLFGLFQSKNDSLDLLVINMQDSLNDVKFSFNRTYGNDSLRCDKITRMYNVVNTQPEVFPHHMKIKLDNMLGGECAVLHFTLY